MKIRQYKQDLALALIKLGVEQRFPSSNVSWELRILIWSMRDIPNPSTPADEAETSSSRKQRVLRGVGSLPQRLRQERRGTVVLSAINQRVLATKTLPEPTVFKAKGE